MMLDVAQLLLLMDLVAVFREHPSLFNAKTLRSSRSSSRTVVWMGCAGSCAHESQAFLHLTGLREEWQIREDRVCRREE